MSQIGSDEKPMTFRQSIYGKSDGGKGARPRINTHSKQYRDNWDLIFGKSKGLGEKDDKNKNKK